MLGLLEIVSIEDLITDGSELGIGNASLVVTVEVLELGKTLDAVPGSLEGLSDGALLGAVLGLLLGNADDIVLVSETYLSTDQDSALPVGSYLVPTKAQSKGVEMVLTTEEWTGTRRETLMVLSWAWPVGCSMAERDWLC